MRKIKLYIAASIDGYIAGPDGELDWLSDYPITPKLNYGYKDFFDSIDTVIMGGRTYRDILNMDVVYPYKDKKSYIITRNAINTPKEDIIYIWKIQFRLPPFAKSKLTPEKTLLLPLKYPGRRGHFYFSFTCFCLPSFFLRSHR